ncbi:MAG: hypothetical protein IPP90_02330 [Gemmatimonadaceae bacterium]|nr:hypothetical protein [Gemmatimonadaceae bacterium]
MTDALSGSVEVRGPTGTLTQSWSAAARNVGRAPLVTIPVGSPVDVEVVNANPLLYRYDVQTTVVARKPLPSCNSLGSRLAATGFLTSFAGIASIAQPVLGQSMGQLFQVPPAIVEAATRGDALITAGAAEAVLTAHRNGVERYVGFLNSVRKLSTTLDDSLAVIAELGESQPTDSLLDGLVRSLERTYTGLSQSARVPLTIRREQDEARPHLSALAGVAKGIARGNYEGDAATGAAAEVSRLTATVSAAQDNLTTSYRTLQALLLRIENAKVRTRQVFSFDASTDIRRLTLDVQPTAEFPEVFRGRVGRQDLYAEPSVSLLCQISVGVGFVNQPPEYVIGNGVIDNRQTDQRFAVAVMLHVAQQKFPILGGLVGFGFGLGGARSLCRWQPSRA